MPYRTAATIELTGPELPIKQNVVVRFFKQLFCRHDWTFGAPQSTHPFVIMGYFHRVHCHKCDKETEKLATIVQHRAVLRDLRDQSETPVTIVHDVKPKVAGGPKEQNIYRLAPTHIVEAPSYQSIAK